MNEKKKQRNANIVYKALGIRCLSQAFCPASAFVSADRNEARNPQRFILCQEAGLPLHAIIEMMEVQRY